METITIRRDSENPNRSNYETLVDLGGIGHSFYMGYPLLEEDISGVKEENTRRLIRDILKIRGVFCVYIWGKFIEINKGAMFDQGAIERRLRKIFAEYGLGELICEQKEDAQQFPIGIARGRCDVVFEVKHEVIKSHYFSIGRGDWGKQTDKEEIRIKLGKAGEKIFADIFDKTDASRVSGGIYWLSVTRPRSGDLDEEIVQKVAEILREKLFTRKIIRTKT